MGDFIYYIVVFGVIILLACTVGTITDRGEDDNTVYIDINGPIDNIRYEVKVVIPIRRDTIIYTFHTKGPAIAMRDSLNAG